MGLGRNGPGSDSHLGGNISVDNAMLGDQVAIDLKKMLHDSHFLGDWNNGSGWP
jgi:hypothetical protein